MRTTVISARNPGQADDEDSRLPDFAERVRLNQRKLSSDLKPQYEVIICGSGFPVPWQRVGWPRSQMSACCARGGSGTTSQM